MSCQSKISRTATTSNFLNYRHVDLLGLIVDPVGLEPTAIRV